MKLLHAVELMMLHLLKKTLRMLLKRLLRKILKLMLKDIIDYRKDIATIIIVEKKIGGNAAVENIDGLVWFG